MADDAETSAVHPEGDATVVGDGLSVPPAELVEIAEKSVLSPGSPLDAPRRYELTRVLGEGGTSLVYAADDCDLEREVAVKVVRADDPLRHELFVREARVMASLGHPNIPPIFDVGQSSGSLYLTTRLITGRSLGSAIRSAIEQERLEVLPVAELVEVMLKLCDALSYAHSRSIIHQDIKPDNVMLGEFGEVMLVDWGAASASSEPERVTNRVLGTPAYMAPEQAQGKAATVRSDVYSLGATLFYALLRRRPIEDPDRDQFWRRKLSGDLDRPTAAELERLPRPLVGIALKALSRDPEERYTSAAELAQALRDYQAGRSAWSAPLVVETFGDQSFRERWAMQDDADFVLERGRLVSKALDGALLVYKTRLAPPVAVEFEGEMAAGAQPGDLSVIWAEDEMMTDGRARYPRRGKRWGLQVGAFSNLLVGIFRDMVKCVSGHGLSLEVGRRYQIRAEIGEHTLRLFVDGELMAEFEDLFAIPAGYFALYAYYPGKSFSNVRIYERGLPERVSAIAVGDAFYARGDHAEAARQYARVEELLPGKPVAEEARYKRGLCQQALGDHDLARRTWDGLSDERLRTRVTLHEVDAAFARGEHEHVVSELRRLLTSSPKFDRTIANRWTEYVEQLADTDIRPLDPYLALRDELFSGDQDSEPSYAKALMTLARFPEVVARFPKQPVYVAAALSQLGRQEEVIARFDHVPFLKEASLIRSNRFSEIPEHSYFHDFALMLMGRVEESKRIFPETLLARGRYEEVLARDDATRADRATALRRLGRRAEAVELEDVRSMVEADLGDEVLGRARSVDARLYACHYLAERAFLGSDRARFAELRANEAEHPQGASWEDVWIHRYVLLPLAAELWGERGALEQSLRAGLSLDRSFFGERLHYAARFILGEIGEAAFMAQPRRIYVQSQLHVCRAVRAEWRGDRANAQRDYRAFLALPLAQRNFDWVRDDPLLERWCRARAGG